ncbi:MAG: VOC family protein [Planctomycetes bacterium]|nr:VOC family protein [Planctomycetota bacterium]
MSDLNQLHNRAVWFDIPVADLDRAISFYKAVLDIGVDKFDFEGSAFGILEHEHGNGGCLVPKPDEVIGDKGLLLYLNAEGRIRDATTKVTQFGGKVLEGIHAIGPHGFRAVIQDSEGNRLALHSMSDQ